MGLLKALFGRNKSHDKESRFSEIGNLDAVCPYCNARLEKKPGRKKKCPHCGSYIHVRTRPSDGERVLVTVGQMKIVDAIRYLTDEQRQEWERTYAQAESVLRKQAGAEPATTDVLWRLLNESLIHFGKNAYWGLYRNTRFEMADLLEQEGRLKNALTTYLEVCYLDVNGPQNLGGMSDSTLGEYPAFHPEGARLAPALVRSVSAIAEKLELDLAEAEGRFLQVADRAHQQLRTPVSPREAWKKLEAELQLR